MRLENTKVIQDDYDDNMHRVISVLRNPVELWQQSGVQMQRTIQNIIFPEGLVYDHTMKDFRKPAEPLLFSFIKEIDEKLPQMAHQSGEFAKSPLAYIKEIDAVLQAVGFEPKPYVEPNSLVSL